MTDNMTKIVKNHAQDYVYMGVDPAKIDLKPEDIICSFPAVSLTVSQVLTEEGVETIKIESEQCVCGKWIVCK